MRKIKPAKKAQKKAMAAKKPAADKTTPTVAKPGRISKLNKRASSSRAVVTLKRVTNNRIVSKIKSLPSYVYLWAVLIPAIVIIALTSANTGGAYSSADKFNITYDHAVSPAEVVSKLNGLGLGELKPTEVKNTNSNEIEFRLPRNEALRKEIIAKMTEDKSTTVVAGFEVEPLSPFSTYLQPVAFVVSVGVVASFLIILLGLVREGYFFRLKLWLLVLIVPILASLVLAAVGIGLSKIGFLLTPDTLALYLAFITGVPLVLAYLLRRQDKREEFVNGFFRD